MKANGEKLDERKLIVPMKRRRIPRRCFRGGGGHFPSNIGSRRLGFGRRYDFVGREREREEILIIEEKKMWIKLK